MNEDLRAWFGKGSGGGAGGGGWDRYNTKGERVGKCAREDKDGDGKGDGPKPKCLSKGKAASMSKAERGAAVRRKRANDPNPDRKGDAIHVNTKKKETNEEVILEKEGKKDACYHKVKASASVWPSAYASGRLVQCRKKGAKNYGKSKKNEEFLALPEFSQIQIDAMRASGIEVEVIDEACWKSHKQVGMKKKGNRMVPNCVPKNEEKISERERVLRELHHKKDGEEHPIEEAVETVKSQTGQVYAVGFMFRGKYMMAKVFFPSPKRPSRDEVQMALDKIYPGARVQRFDMSHIDYSDPYINMPVKEEVEEVEEGAAWTKKSGKNSEGGLNEKGRKSYEAQNPGSDLKAPTKKVGNPRRASFCARMKGMKKKLTSKKTASDPDSRINKSLRKWNC